MQKIFQAFNFHANRMKTGLTCPLNKQKRALQARFVFCPSLLAGNNDAILHGHLDGFTRNQCARQYLLRQRVFDLLLDGTF